MSDPDRELLERWQAGDREAGNALVRRRIGEITWFFRNKVTNETDVADLVGQTFLGCLQAAAGFRGEELVTEIDTHTFLFIADVLKQTGAGAPRSWGTNGGKDVVADYEMDPEIVNHPAYRNVLPEALRSLPALSLVMNESDLYGTARGIYAKPMQSGDDWERATSAEFIPADGAKGFQIDCGLRIQGGWNRRPDESPKHAFRLAFRKKYGAGKLKFPLFPGPGSEEFDNLILRAGCNNSWLHWNGAERRRGDYLRDQWMRETYAAMTHPSARAMPHHNLFVVS